MNNKTYRILKDNRIILSMILLAIPVMLSNVLKSIHDIVDMYFIGNIKDEALIVEAQVSAITITGPIFQICQALALGLMIAGTAIMSQYVGAKKEEKAKKVSAQLLILSIVIGVIFNVLLFVLSKPLIAWMVEDTSSELYKYAVTYIRYRSFELVGLFVIYSFQATRQSMGDTVTPVILNAISVVLNIILTWVFLTFFGMDISGASLGTVIANMAIVPAIFVMLVRRKNNMLNLELTDLKPDFKYIKKLFNLGLPAAISQAFTSLGFLLINKLVAGFDGYIINAIGVGNRINSLLLFPAMSVGTVLSTFIGQNIGAEQIDRAKKSLWSAMKISLAITICGAILLLFLRGPIVSIFIDPELNPNAFDMCVYYLFFLLIVLPLMGIFQVWNSCFQGAGRTELSLLLSTVRLWVLRLPLIWFLMNVIDAGPSSVWYAMIISNFGACILGCFLYKYIDYKPRISKMKQKLIKEEEMELQYGQK